MSDEQMIYIDPEDDLTNVRTRLEAVESRHVTLVIPAQTQLRSHVAWKLLHARARELGKDILIISADPQIRSVAQAVKFRVANSLEAAQENKARPATRPGRSIAPSKGRSTTARIPRSRQLPPSDPWPTPRSGSSQSLEGKRPRLDEGGASGNRSSSIHSFGADERAFGQAFDFGGEKPPSIQSLSEAPIEDPDFLDEDFQQAQIIREAASQEGEDDAGDLDFSPRSKLGRDNIHAMDAPRITPRPISEDPFTFMEEKETGPGKSEQKGRARLHNYDTNQHAIQDVSELPTDIPGDDIEFEGDLGDFVVHSDTAPKTQHHSWAEPTPDDEEDFVGPAKNYGVRPRGSRSGQVPPLPRQQQIESEDALPPIEERSTQIGRSSRPLAGSRSDAFSPRRSQPMAGSRADPLTPRVSKPLAGSRSDAFAPRPSKPLISGARSGTLSPRPAPPQVGSRSDALRAAPLDNRTEMQQFARERQRPSKPLSQQEVARAVPAPIRGRVAAPASNKPRTQRPSTSTKNRFGLPGGGTVFVTAIIIFFLLVALVAYLIPSADVNVFLPGRAYAHPIQLTLTANRASGAGKVTGAPLTQNLSLKGSGTATGTTLVGTIPAQGSVIFTNNSSTVTTRIPTGVVVATTTGLQFVTTSDAVASPKGGSIPNSVQVPVQAAKPGDAGNVAENSILVIPDDSIGLIARATNAQVSDIQLTVVNPQPVTGGGAGNAPQVKQQDLDAAQANLSKQLQANFMTWLKTQLAPGDIPGLPTKTEKLINQPEVNHVLPSGTSTFSLELQGTYTVLVLRNIDAQNATRDQLNTDLAKAFNNYTIANGAPITIDHLTIKNTGNDQLLSFTANGQAVPSITVQSVKSQIIGRSVTDARTKLQESVQLAYHSDGVRVDIKTTPGFILWVPFRSDNIQVHFFATVPTKPVSGKSK